MRVSLVGPAYPYRGGIAHFTSMLAREFSGEHQVQIVNFSRLYPSVLFPGKTQFDDSDSPLRVDSERLIDCINPVSFVRAANAIVRFEPDLVVVQWWQPFFGPAFHVICALAKPRIKAKIVFLCHNVLPHESSVLDRVLIKIGLAKADAFLVQSTEDGNNLHELKARPRMDINPHPIYDFFNENKTNRDDARRILKLEGRVMLFFGYIRAYKGVRVLLEAFAECAEELDATLLVVGEFYEKREPYDQLVEQLGIGPRVRIVDQYVPNEDVETYFKASDLVVLPYKSATQSGIVQTAFSFEKPVVVTAVGGLPDVVTDGVTGYVVPPGDPESLADSMRRFFAENRASAMSAAIRADRDRFSWARCAHALLALGDLTDVSAGSSPTEAT